MTDEFLKCPECGGEDMIEWAKQLTFQKGVRVRTDGNRDYEGAGCNEFSDDCEITGYQCQGCRTDLILKGGALIVEE